MAEAKITVSAQDLASAVLDSVNKKLRETGTVGEESSKKLSGFGKFIDDLTPSTRNAQAAFTDLHGTLTDVWQDPTSAVKQLAGAVGGELSSGLGSAGIAAGLTAAGFAVLAGASFELASRAAVVGGSINDMSEKMGESAAKVSNLRGAAIIAGSSLDQISNAMFMFQRNMGEGTQTFTDGLDRIHVSMQQLQQLSPADQFLQIATALRNVDDPAERAAAGAELFGRQFRDLAPLVMKPLDELVEKSRELGSTWSDEDAQAAENFDMQLNALKLQIENVFIGLGRDLIPGISTAVTWLGSAASFTVEWTGKLSGLTAILTTTRDAARFAIDAYDVLTGKSVDLPKVTGNATIALRNQRDAMKDLQLQIPGLDQALSNDKEQHTELDDQIRRSIETHKKLQQALRDYGDSGRTYEELLRTIGNDTYEGIAYDLARGKSIEGIAAAYGISKQAVEDVKRVEAEYTKDLAVEVRLVEESRKANEDAATAIGKGLAPEMYRLRQGVVDATAASETFNQQAIGLMPNLASQAREHMDELTGSIFGFGSAAEDTLANIPHLVQSALTGGGGLSGGLNAAGSIFGTNIGRSISSHIADQITNFGDNPENLSKITGGLLSAIPVVGSLIGPALGALVGKLFGGPSQQELAGRDVVSQFETQMGGWQKIQQALLGTGLAADQVNAKIQAMWAAEKNGADAAKASIAEINQVLADQQQDAQDLNAAISRYGFTLSELGPTLQRQQLDAQAQQLINDWRLLVGAGVDVVTVDQHMAASMNDYLRAARQTGTEVPEAMQPILQKMIEQGDLTDDNGGKITDMSQLGVKFSETMTEGFQKVVDKLDQLLQKIGVALPQAIGQVPTSVDVDVNLNARWNVPELPREEQSFANEAFDLSTPTRAIVGDAKGQSESVLHASTVRDIVRAARNAGASTGTAALAGKLDDLNRAFARQSAKLERALLYLPANIRTAMAGA